MCKNSVRQKLTQHRNSETETKETGGVRVSEGGHRNQSTKLRKEFLISRVNEWIRPTTIRLYFKNGHINGTLTKCRKVKSRISLWTESLYLGHLKCRLLYFRMHILLMSLTHYTKWNFIVVLCGGEEAKESGRTSKLKMMQKRKFN